MRGVDAHPCPSCCVKRKSDLSSASAAVGPAIFPPILLTICLSIVLPVLLPVHLAILLPICLAVLLSILAAIGLPVLLPIRSPIFLADIGLRERHAWHHGWGGESHDQAGQHSGFQQIVPHNSSSLNV